MGQCRSKQLITLQQPNNSRQAIKIQRAYRKWKAYKQLELVFNYQIEDEDPHEQKTTDLQIFSIIMKKPAVKQTEVPIISLNGYSSIDLPEVKDSPKNAVKLSQGSINYSHKVTQIMIKLGTFPYKQHISRYQNDEESKKPFLDPYQLDNDHIYIGQWKEGRRHGRGKNIWPDGQLYEGFWFDDQQEGMGRIIYTNGDYYIGEFSNGKFNGQGVFKNSQFEYKGEFQDDIQDGKGEEKWEDGSEFKGTYKKGIKSGSGKFFFKDGSSYEGEIKNDKFNGKGLFKWNDGKFYNGEWVDNKMHGYGQFKWQDGRQYDGQYKNDLKNGFGEFKYEDGKIYRGNWVNGKQHGKGIYISKTGISREGEWHEGKRVKWLGDYSIEC